MDNLLKKGKFYLLLLLSSLSMNTGCYLFEGIAYQAAGRAGGLVNEGMDTVENDIRARINGKLVDANLNTPFQLGYDQTATLRNTGLRLKFSAVTEESRCGTDLQCKRDGQVTVLLMVSRNGAYLGNFNFTIGQGNSSRPAKRIDNYTVRLNSLEPSAFTSYNRPMSNDYSVNLTVSR